MSQYRQQVIEQLGIDIDLFLQRIKIGTNDLSALDQEIFYQSLLGDSRKQIATRLGLSPEQVRDRLGDYIYPGMAHLIPAEPGEKAGNWVKILNFLLNPQNGYRLNPTPQLNSDNFQGSFGRQIFLYPTHQAIVRSQIEASQFYQQGLYYAALQCFLDAWQKEKEIYQNGNPEVLIYINNSLVEYQRSLLQEKGIQVYTIAVVVPFHHNQGRIAAEILRGVAQIQSQINFAGLDRLTLLKDFNLDVIPCDRLTGLSSRIGQSIALRVLIVNDPNNLHDPFNQTAEKLAGLATQLNLIAIVGHYSSEMTQKALQFYAKQGIPLINASSTANSLSHLSKGEQLLFFRVTTQDQINGAALAQYLVQVAAEIPKRVAIIYNKNSQYSTSYRTTVKEYLDWHSDRFIFLEECGELSERFEYIQNYLNRIQVEKVEIIILIPDGGLEPNSLNNTGLISRFNLQNCLIAGSATFYQENILHWMHERQINGDNQNCQPMIACVPWHWHSHQNGGQSKNLLASSFCELGYSLWGEEQLTWRSATSFDAVLVILRILEQYSCADSQDLMVHLNQYFKDQQKQIQGVTGRIQFHSNGDRIDPPTEILTVKSSQSFEDQNIRWRWMPVVEN